MPGDDEQRVVDPDAEGDHAAQLRHPAGHRDQVGEQRHRADAEGETEDGHPDRQAHGDERSERDEEDDDRRDQPDQLAGPHLRLLEGEEQIAAHLDPERRTRRGLAAERLQGLEVALLELLDHRIPQADERDATVGRGRGVARARADHAGQGGGLGPQLGQRGSRLGRIAEGDGAVARRQDELRGQPGPVRPGPAEQLAGPLGVESRDLDRVLELPSEGARRRDDERGDAQPGSDDPPGSAGGEATQAVQGVRHRGASGSSVAMDRCGVATACDPA